MTLPAQVAVGNHSNDGEITDLQNAMNGVLPILRGVAPLPGDLEIAGSLVVDINLNVNQSLIVTGAAEMNDLQVDGTLGVLGALVAGFPTPATVAQAGRIYQGSGVPSNANGNNGDVYFRTDTPATANQRLYIRSAGAWIGIV